MRARIFSGDSWVGEVLVSGVGVEVEAAEGRGEEERVELRRVNEERSSSLRRAIVVRDMVSLERIPGRRKRDVLDAIEGATVGSRNPDTDARD